MVTLSDETLWCGLFTNKYVDGCHFTYVEQLVCCLCALCLSWWESEKACFCTRLMVPIYHILRYFEKTDRLPLNFVGLVMTGAQLSFLEMEGLLLYFAWFFYLVGIFIFILALVKACNRQVTVFIAHLLFVELQWFRRFLILRQWRCPGWRLTIAGQQLWPNEPWLLTNGTAASTSWTTASISWTLPSSSCSTGPTRWTPASTSGAEVSAFDQHHTSGHLSFLHGTSSYCNTTR